MLELHAAFFLAPFLTIVLSQTTHVVNVGVEGSFYSPPTISAGLNDTVTFIFGGDSHTVTQSSFNSPCIRLNGGFDSGFNGRGADFSKPAPVWSLRITNVSETIWFFCQASIPSSHCFSGMVGAINPPSILMYNEFVSAARLVTSTPKPSPSFIASGEGAFATNSPIPSSISMTSPPFSSVPTTSSSSSSATSSVPPTPPGTSESRTNVGLIAGCATAGGVVVLILAFLVIRHWRRRTAYRSFPTPTPSSMREVDGMLHERSAKSAVLTYDPTSTTGTQTFPVMSPPSTAGLYNDEDADERTNASAGSFPRPIRPLPRTPSQNQLRRQGGSHDGDVDEAPGQHVDINTLAMEVANVLLHTPPREGSRQHLDSLHNRQQQHRYESSASHETHHTAPPNYRAI
ncbi:hypothetical protein B0H16DRAFT_901740 [Mycena metata]|uniref:Extracellular serine-rich protein n=1 Tax=Mycena metata TaxID=1033252 RepID=A0AAD7ITB6_9AGAR|nr:hypothetical protein B0H16DRAFT_901740 [Mycena metata]